MKQSKEFFEIIKSVMPEHAEYYENSQIDDFGVSVAWKIGTDGGRPNKRSKTIAIVIDENVVEDFEEMPSDVKQRALSRFRSALSERLSSFEPDHPMPIGDPEPVEKWFFSSTELLG